MSGCWTVIKTGDEQSSIVVECGAVINNSMWLTDAPFSLANLTKVGRTGTLSLAERAGFIRSLSALSLYHFASTKQRTTSTRICDVCSIFHSGIVRFYSRTRHHPSCLRILVFFWVTPTKCWYTTMKRPRSLPFKSFPIRNISITLSFKANFLQY